MATRVHEARPLPRVVATDSAKTHVDRRTARRLEMHIPVECRLAAKSLNPHCGEKPCTVLQTVARNISSGGMYLEGDDPPFAAGDVIDVALTLPPGEGVSPFPGLARTQAEVLRIQRIGSGAARGKVRYGLAARFIDRLRFEYQT